MCYSRHSRCSLLRATLCVLTISILTLLSQSALAVGLGDIKVYSYLNEPFSAEIMVNNAEGLDVHNLYAELASPKDFMRTGIPRPFFLTKLKFEVIRINNITVIYISSSRPVKNPFLDFLVELIWQEGKIVKSYTVLLDPIADQTVKREIPISQQKKTTKKENIHNNVSAKHITDPNDLAVPQINKISQHTDAIFATALEDLSHEALANEPKEAPMKVYAMEGVATDPDETIEKQSKNHHHFYASNGVLDKVASSLQIFGQQQPKRIKIDYEKLLNLQPSGADLHKDATPLAESLAMIQINSELESLRNKNNNSNSNSNSNSNNSAYNSTAVTNTISNTNTMINTNAISDNYLELIKKYGNDLLLACFLVSTTIYLFYKMVQPNPYTVHINKNRSLSIPYGVKQYSNQQHDDYSEHFDKHDLSLSIPQHDSHPTTILDPLHLENHELNELLKQANNYPDGAYANSAYITKNEELELKIALAKQYIEAGDQKSAREILQNMSSIKDSKYQEQIDGLLKCIG